MLHTPLKRARLPITPPEPIFSKNYLFAAGFAGGSTAVADELLDAEFAFEAELDALAFAAGAFAAGVAFALEFALELTSDGAELELASLETAVFESVFAAGASAGLSGLLERTETFPVNAGIARNKAESINVEAAMIVIFDRTVAVPRGARAELETLLVNNAPASVFPGCRRTDATRTIQDKKNIAYKM